MPVEFQLGNFQILAVMVKVALITHMQDFVWLYIFMYIEACLLDCIPRRYLALQDTAKPSLNMTMPFTFLPTSKVPVGLSPCGN